MNHLANYNNTEKIKSICANSKYGTCRFCKNELETIFIDLGMSPLSNSYLKHDQLNNLEPFYPLITFACNSCYLVQLLQYESCNVIFSDYAYFSSYSNTWLEHSKKYADMVTEKIQLNNNSLVIELASNDGYLLQYFKNKNIPVLGIEPAQNVARAAKEKGIPTIARFFGMDLAQELVGEGKKADLIIGNNVLAHVPNINNFVAGMKVLLKPNGIITMEFPHLLQLIKFNQFDTIYHEHFSYFSLISVQNIFEHHGLKIFDVEQISTHGGSLRIYASHSESRSICVSDRVELLLFIETDYGLKDIHTYVKFSKKIKDIKFSLLKGLINIKENGKKIVAYGAAAKGNTLLNYCGIRTDFIDYVVDLNPYKVGKFLPGTHVPIKSIEKIKEDRPDYVLILPWNIKKEIIEQIKYIRDWSGRFIVPIPSMHIID